MNNQRGSTSNLKVKKNHSKKLAQCHDAAKKKGGNSIEYQTC